MFLRNLNLTNFRKFKELSVEFQHGLNVLVGENDSGKTAIIDAIRHLLNTKSFENVRLEPRDFHRPEGAQQTDSLIIEAIFSGFEDAEAASFIEWGYFDGNKAFELRVVLTAKLINGNRIIRDIKAGPKNGETALDGNAKELLQVTYLKPLRDAEVEMTPGYRSRLAEILQSLKDFRKKMGEDGKPESHKLEAIVATANKEIEEYLRNVKPNGDNNLIDSINTHIEAFRQEGDTRKASIKIADSELHKILRTLGLALEENNSGLGTLNKLFMAAELLHLNNDPYNSIRLCLIEELEAHLHPQAQLRVIDHLKKISEIEDGKNQFILTTHSTTIGASIPLKNLIICRGSDVFPMSPGNTALALGDYKFLQRFLDATKANLFFARGVILVEGDAENILTPTIAEVIDMPLHKYGVSIVNVGSTAFLRYAKIFQRTDEKSLDIRVSVVTDLDIRALEYYKDNKDSSRPTFYQVTEKSITDSKSQAHDISALNGEIFASKDELKTSIKKVIDEERMPNGLNDIIDDWAKIELNVSTIDDIRSAKASTLSKRFDNGFVKVFNNESWTLEYDLAFDNDLQDLFAQAVVIAQKIKSSELYFEHLIDGEGNSAIPYNNPESPEDSLHDLVEKLKRTGSLEAIAYNIFKPFISNDSPSKAVTAQIFSELLLKDRVKNRGILEKSESSLKYIIDAIKYACNQDASDAEL